METWLPDQSISTAPQDQGPQTTPAPLPPENDASVDWKAKKLRLSLFPEIIDKNVNKASFTEGFKNYPVTIDELAQWVGVGKAYCAELKGPRKDQNFVASDILSIDIDSGMTLEELLENPVFHRYGSMVYTTASHTPENHRLRAIFITERTIDDAAVMRAARRALTLRLSGDPATIDPTRISYGSRGCFAKTFDRGIPISFLDELIAQGRETSFKVEIDGSLETISSRSRLPLPKDLMVKVKGGGFVCYDSLAVRHPVHCPFHNDRKPSAFIIANREGTKGIHCSACGASFWPQRISAAFDFDSFEKAARAVQDHTAPGADYTDWFIRSGMGDALNEANIVFMSQQYLGDVPVREGANFIKSPKGSGKTEFLKTLVDRNPKASFLLVGHRRTLIQQMCDRLGLNCYLEDPPETTRNSARKKRYGICLDSIAKIPSDSSYDYVLVDESEQVLAHFLSSTLGEKRNASFLLLRQLVASAKHVIALDADLGWISFKFIGEWSRRKKPQSKAWLLINEFQTTMGKLELFGSGNELIGDMRGLIRDGRRCYFTSNSRSQVEKLEASLAHDIPKAKLLSVTASTAGDSRTQAFLNDPANEALKYDVILASPSIGSGVDISFPDKAALFDVVYGYFEPLVLTHFECDQQLSRVRHPKAVKVYMSRRRFDFETNFEVVLNDALSLNMMSHLIKGYDDEGTPQFREDDDLLELIASVLSLQRASVNDLQRQFIGHKRKQGWDIFDVGGDKALRREGSLAQMLGRRLTEEQEIARLLEARSVSEDEFDEILQKKNSEYRLSETEHAEYLKELIRRFYRQPVTSELIKLDKKGHYRERVRNYEMLINQRNFPTLQQMEIGRAQDRAATYDVLFSPVARVSYIMQALTAAGLFSDGKIEHTKAFSLDDLSYFIEFVSKGRKKFESMFNAPLHKDFRANPVKQLSVFLKEIGLKIKRIRKTRSGTKSIYVYAIDPKSYDILIVIVEKRGKRSD